MNKTATSDLINDQGHFLQDAKYSIDFILENTKDKKIHEALTAYAYALNIAYQKHIDAFVALK